MRQTTLAMFMAASFATSGVALAQASVSPQPREAQGSAAVANPNDASLIPSTTSSATTRGADMPGTASGTVGMTGGTYGDDRMASSGMRRWLAMPFPLVLWLLLSPIAFVLMSRGPGPSARHDGATVRTDARTDTRLAVS